MPPTNICELCDKTFTKPYNLKRHYINVHSTCSPNAEKNVQHPSPSFRCGICSLNHCSFNEFVTHLRTGHNIALDIEDLEFQNLGEFENWKKSIEVDCCFVKHRGDKDDGNVRTAYYMCNRSGSSKSTSSKRERQGTSKINAYCPARIKAKFNRDGKITVSFCKTHIGHDFELAHIRLPDDEKQDSDSQIAQKISLDTIEMSPTDVCELCDKTFTKPYNLKRHYINVHSTCSPNAEKNVQHPSPSFTCGICSLNHCSFNEFVTHLRTGHNIALDIEDLEFQNLGEFENWKKSIEVDCCFVKHRGDKDDGNVRTAYYMCNRSGSSKSTSSKGECQGTSKINAYCPARIKAKFNRDGKITVSFCKTHIGHDFELAHIRLPDDEKQDSDSQIAQKISLDTIEMSPTDVCELCDKTFTKPYNLKRHYINVHSTCSPNAEKNVQHPSPSFRCGICSLNHCSFKEFVTHLRTGHNIALDIEDLEFQNLGEFENWKKSIEVDCCFVKHRGDKDDGNVRTAYYMCNRSGSSKSTSSKRERQGTSKINAYCPARIKAKFNRDGKITVSFCKTHIGHDFELAHIRLPDDEKQDSDSQIAQKISLDTIEMSPTDVCELCDKTFTKPYNLKRHYINVHSTCSPNAEKNVQHPSPSFTCGICSLNHCSFNEFVTHLRTGHNIALDIEDLEFQNLGEFENWKKSIEVDCCFVKHRGDKDDGNVRTAYYMCNRSGSSKSTSSKGECQGTSKINAYCPARIKAKFNRDGKITVSFCKTHIGHDFELAHIRLPDDEKQDSDSHIAQKISLDTIEMSPTDVCELCDKTFTKTYNLKRHYINVHSTCSPNAEKNVQHSSPSFRCGICSLNHCSFNEFVTHLMTGHNITLDNEDLEFQNLCEFENWKKSIEVDCWFVKHTGDKEYVNVRTAYYMCNRSGSFQGKTTPSKRKRHLKIQGTSKVNAYCPARIKAKFNRDGKITVSFCKTHVGHDLDLAHIRLPDDEKKALASQIAKKIPFDTIVENIQCSVEDDVGLQRKHLITKQDLRNISKEYSLDSERNSDDASSIEAWVEAMKKSENNCVLLYKAYGVESTEYPLMKTEDFMLGIMTEAQAEMLKKYGEDCICMDSTHGTNAYGFEMTTVLVLDDTRQGFPCAFFFSNRNDHVSIETFLKCIRDKVGVINARTLMSDMANVFYNSWKCVMGDVQNRLFCTWHVQRAWTKKNILIKNETKREEVSKKLFTLLYEVDERAFEAMLPEIINDFLDDKDTHEYGKYFQVNYYTNRQSWAYCYRKNAGINTNMHLERLHGIFKHFYLKGKMAKRSDVTIHALMRFINNKLFDRLIVLHKGKLTSKVRCIRERHSRSLSLSMDNVIFSDNDTWTVYSSSSSAVLNEYTVTLNNRECSCSIKCVYCQACIHKFKCTCTDACIKWNMCKHIHLVCRAQKSLQVEGSARAQKFQVEGSANTCQTEESSESKFIVSAVKRHKQNDSDLETIKQNVSDLIGKLLTKSEKSYESMEVLQKYLKMAEPIIDEVLENDMKSEPFPMKKNINIRRKIDPQRKFKLKKMKKNQSRIQKPESHEAQTIAVSALLKHEEAMHSTPVLPPVPVSTGVSSVTHSTSFLPPSRNQPVAPPFKKKRRIEHETACASPQRVGDAAMRNRTFGDSHSSSPPPATCIPPRSIPLSPLVVNLNQQPALNNNEHRNQTIGQQPLTSTSSVPTSPAPSQIPAMPSHYMQVQPSYSPTAMVPPTVYYHPFESD